MSVFKTVRGELDLEYGWTLGNQSIIHISNEECKAAMASLWPPSDAILLKLGMGRASDAEWWKKFGLLPPVDWNVQGPFDLLDSNDKKSSTRRPVSLQSRTQVQCAASVLDGAIHGVTNVWCKETLQDLRNIMHSSNFWLFRKNDAYIRVFGGPYVLGQKADSLDLVNGHSHNVLTAMICVAQNLVYTAVHLETPPAPGFNTIIFGLNLNASGRNTIYERDCSLLMISILSSLITMFSIASFFTIRFPLSSRLHQYVLTNASRQHKRRREFIRAYILL